MASEVAGIGQSREGFIRGLRLLDSTIIIVESSSLGIFIASADIVRQTGSPGKVLLTWIISGIPMIFTALS